MIRSRMRGAVSAGVAMVFAAVGWLVVLPPAAEAKPSLKITTVVSGLNVPWDLTWVGT